MFSDLPKLFDRNFVTGYLLPSILFGLGTCLLAWLAFGVCLVGVQYALPQQGSASSHLVIQDTESATLLLGVFTLACLVLAVLLLVLNRFFIRLLEGYVPPVSWFWQIEAGGFQRLQQDFQKVVVHAYFSYQR